MTTTLRNTFVHIPRISANTELALWQRGIHDWDALLEANGSLSFLSPQKQDLLTSQIQHSVDCFKKKDFGFFIDALPTNQHWRAYDELKQDCCFLDIETTGLSKHRDDVTVIGLYDGKKSNVYINGQNLDDFQKELRKYSTIVTFNGRCFDVPFLRAKFPEADFNKFHIDLRFAMKKVGYSGGLKMIERQVGIERDDELAEVDGFEAVRLWKRYKKGDKDALDLLIKYNIADIENLKYLMELTFKELKEKEFLSHIR